MFFSTLLPLILGVISGAFSLIILYSNSLLDLFEEVPYFNLWPGIIFGLIGGTYLSLMTRRLKFSISDVKLPFGFWTFSILGYLASIIVTSIVMVLLGFAIAILSEFVFINLWGSNFEYSVTGLFFLLICGSIAGLTGAYFLRQACLTLFTNKDSATKNFPRKKIYLTGSILGGLSLSLSFFFGVLKNGVLSLPFVFNDKIDISLIWNSDLVYTFNNPYVHIIWQAGMLWVLSSATIAFYKKTDQREKTSNLEPSQIS